MPRPEKGKQLEAASRALKPASVIERHITIVSMRHRRADRKKVADSLDIRGDRTACPLMLVLPVLTGHMFMVQSQATVDVLNNA
jgi:hypothetical protein